MNQPFLVTMTQNNQRTRLEIPAASSVDAVIIGMNLMRKNKASGSISSKPARRVTT